MMVLVGLVVDRVLLYKGIEEDHCCFILKVVPSRNIRRIDATPRIMVVIDETTGVITDLRTTDIDCNVVLYDAYGVDCSISNRHLLPTTEHEELKNVSRIISFPENSTLMPGFIDCHVHLTIATDDYQIDHLRLSSADKALRALKAAQGLLLAGFTTVRSAGDADAFYPSFAAARSINKGDFHGSRIVGAGHYISVTGGGGDMNFMSPDNFGSCSCCSSGSDGIIADGQDQMIAAVRKEIKYGSDWIKVLASGAFMSASTNAQDSPENTHLSAPELAACVEEARRRRVPVMAHAHGAESILLAAEAGCRSIEHASFIDLRGVQACLRNNTWIVPTFSVGAHFEKIGSATGAQDRCIDLLRQTDERFNSCIRSAVAAGVKVALGSDYVGWDPSINAREFRFLVERAGMTPMQAIMAGTCSAADLLGRPDLGRICKGAVADIVVINGNPLEDISLLQSSILLVMKEGRVIKGISN